MRPMPDKSERRMLTEEIVCPNCGELTLVNLPAAREHSGYASNAVCACRHCKKRINYSVRQEIGAAGVIDRTPWPGE